MAIYDESDGEAFAQWETAFLWMPNVLAVEYGEWETENEVPVALNWLELLPEDPRYDFDEVECSLAYVNDTTGYAATVWDVSGEDDLPWAVILADAYGVRLLSEYSVLDETADEETLETVLAKAAAQLPLRLEAGEFDRVGEPLDIPDWLLEVNGDDAGADGDAE
ncbi:MAG: hypothetical protein H7Y38_15265 [Armatimonadetes bacterium]|nr:hypothetical protein [Armatimonadota bacterium]